MSPSTTYISTIPTPNPNAMMFRVDETLVSAGTYEYLTIEGAKESPLAAKLLGNDGIERVLIAPRFVTIEKSPAIGWEALTEQVKSSMMDFLDSGEMAVFEPEPEEPADLSDVERQILTLLDEEVRPSIAKDGGDVEFHGFIDGMVRLKLIGACGSCPSSTATLKFGIERLLMEEIPEVMGVEQIASESAAPLPQGW